MALSFDTYQIVDVEPPKESWDLVFTQYTHAFIDPPVSYLVTGVLSNRYRVQVAVDRQKNYSEIAYGDIASYVFRVDLNVIGFDWKEYDFDTGSYTVFPEINYVIKDSEGRHYKLHFTDFYDDTGEKGTPKFELQEL